MAARVEHVLAAVPRDGAGHAGRMQHFTADDGVKIAYDTLGHAVRPTVRAAAPRVRRRRRLNWVAGDHLSAVGDPRSTAGLVEFLGG